MSEVEFDRLLDTVRTAIELNPQEGSLATRQASSPPMKAANDNEVEVEVGLAVNIVL